MKVIVTGGAGFIGSHLVEELVRKGFRVTVIDNLYRGRIENIQPFLQKINFHQKDISDYNEIKSIFKNHDVVFHLAAISSAGPCSKNQNLCFKTNIIGTYNVLNACIENKVKKIIFASSRDVYGDPEYLPIDEKHPLRPKNFYGLTKLFGELLCQNFQKYGLEYVCLRKSNVYGERDFGRVIPIFLEKAKKGEDIVIFGGEQVLDFIYVKDVINAYLKALEYGKSGIFNIGVGKGIPISDIAELIKEYINININIKFEKSRNFDVEKYIPNTDAAKRELKFKAIYKIKDFLRGQ